MEKAILVISAFIGVGLAFIICLTEWQTVPVVDVRFFLCKIPILC